MFLGVSCRLTQCNTFVGCILIASSAQRLPTWLAGISMLKLPWEAAGSAATQGPAALVAQQKEQIAAHFGLFLFVFFWLRWLTAIHLPSSVPACITNVLVRSNEPMEVCCAVSRRSTVTTSCFLLRVLQCKHRYVQLSCFWSGCTHTRGSGQLCPSLRRCGWAAKSR